MAHRTSDPLWTPRGGGFWQGEWQDTGPEFEVIDPDTERVIARVRDCSPDETRDAVDELVAEQKAARWALWERREALSRSSRLLCERSDIATRLISAESGCTIREARGEVARAVETLDLYSRMTTELTGGMLPFEDSRRGGGRVGWTSAEPLGVVAAITPFNCPLNMAVHKVAPALVAGNCVALKPSGLAPLSALFLTEVLLEAGVPPSRIATLPGSGAETGRALVRHPGVTMVTFTGGTETGLEIVGAAGLKRVQLELGGNGVVIVCEDADMVAAARAVVDGAFGYAGQNCISVQRVLVASEVVSRFIALVEREASVLVVGPSSSEATDVGPLIDACQVARVSSWVDAAVAAGARVILGQQHMGPYYWPTVLTDVPHTADVWCMEAFGPVVCIEAFSSLAGAIDVANDVDFGLQAGVYTGDITRGLAIARQLETGTVLVNDTCDYRLDSMPFGGPKASGLGREGAQASIREMTAPKNFILTPPASHTEFRA